jgi:hypothetical protein
MTRSIAEPKPNRTPEAEHFQIQHTQTYTHTPGLRHSPRLSDCFTHACRPSRTFNPRDPCSFCLHAHNTPVTLSLASRRKSIRSSKQFGVCSSSFPLPLPSSRYVLLVSWSLAKFHVADAICQNGHAYFSGQVSQAKRWETRP